MSEYENFLKSTDPSWQVLFRAYYAEDEEDDWIIIFEKDNQYLQIKGGHSVMLEPEEQYPSHILISEDEVYEQMQEWEEFEDN